MNVNMLRTLAMVLGGVGVVVTAFYDIFRPGPAEFGRKQFAGFIISIFILLFGLRSAFPSKKRLLDCIMLGVYLLGMLFLVLMPASHHPDPSKGLLEVTAFLPVDFGVNILGFVPLGYLWVSLLQPQTGRRASRYVAVIFSSFVLSFLIEVLQFFIDGRTSSVNDVISNGLGSAVGVFYYHFEDAMKRYRRRMLSVRNP